MPAPRLPPPERPPPEPDTASGERSRSDRDRGAAPQELAVEAWPVRDTGLVAVPGPLRRLPGLVRHRRDGSPWPATVVIRLGAQELLVEGVGRWPRSAVRLRAVSPGPPATFVLELPDEVAGDGRTVPHLLAAAPGPAVDALLTALSPTSS